MGSFAGAFDALAKGALSGVANAGKPKQQNGVNQLMQSVGKKIRKRKKNGQYVEEDEDTPDLSDATSPEAMAALSAGPKLPPMLTSQQGGSPMMGQMPMGNMPLYNGIMPPKPPGPMPY